VSSGTLNLAEPTNQLTYLLTRPLYVYVTVECTLFGVAVEPSCAATETTVQDGSRTELTCSMQWSGDTRPVMTWFSGDHDDDDEELDSLDLDSVRNARRDVHRTVTIDDDRRPFRCVTVFGQMQRVCQVVVQVPRECILYTVSQKKLCQCNFLNNSVKHCPILIIFDTQHREET